MQPSNGAPNGAPPQGKPASSVSDKMSQVQLNPEELVEALGIGLGDLEKLLVQSKAGSPQDLKILSQIKQLFGQLSQSLNASPDSPDEEAQESGPVPPEVGGAKGVVPAM